LAVDPAELSLLDVVTAVEGEVGSSTCVMRGGPCGGEERCVVHVPWSRAQQAMTDELAATSFAELVEHDRSLETEELAMCAFEAGAADPPPRETTPLG
jgi:DNA-binding IscR family transcriptional regulator